MKRQSPGAAINSLESNIKIDSGNRRLVIDARLWNSLPIECFPLTYDLNSFKSRINRHLLTEGSF